MMVQSDAISIKSKICNNSSAQARLSFHSIYPNIKLVSPLIQTIISQQQHNILKYQSMKFFHYLKQVIKFNDLFYAKEMLRYNQQMEYKTLTGGLFSLAIIIAVTIGFANMIINTFNLTSITFFLNVSKDSSPTPSTLKVGIEQKFMMAVSIQNMNLSQIHNYFDINMIQTTFSNGNPVSFKPIPLETCTRNHWAAFPQIASRFEELQMTNWLCPPLGTDLKLSGDISSDLYEFVVVHVDPCNSSNKQCASRQQVASLIKKHSDALMFTIYYPNTLVNPGQKQFISYYLQSNNYIYYGATIGGEAYLYVSSYSIETDYSILPFSQIETVSGLMIKDQFVVHPYTTFIGTYAAFILAKSPTSYGYHRSVQKISTVLAFIGGLVSSISASLFILKVYNNLAFEVMLGLSIFKPPVDNNIDTQALGMNFWNFCKFYLYKLFKFMGKPFDWPQVQFVAECQKEIMNQIDIKALVKRVIFLQFCITHLFEDYHLEGLQIKKPKTPHEIRKIRQKCESLDEFDDQEQLPKPIAKSHKDLQSVQFNLDGIQEVCSAKSNSMMSINNRMSKHVFVVPHKSLQREANLKKTTIGVSQIQEEPKFKERPLQKKPIMKNFQRKSINLMMLKQNAKKGDQLSKKILKQLDQNKMKGIFIHQKLQQVSL